LQANFGAADASPTAAGDTAARDQLTAEIGELETTLATLADPESEEAVTMRERLAELTAELAELATEAPETPAWDGDWRTANLDITGDGVVDLADLEAARQFGGTPALEGDASEDDAGEAPDDTLAEDTTAEEAPLEGDGTETVEAGA
jgi:hypothetical protein